MNYYPVYLDLRGRSCIVIGGGPVAERKTLTLLESGASVTLISPSMTSPLRKLAESGSIKHISKQFDEKDLSDEFLVIAATDSPEVNTQAAAVCRKRRILVNTVVPPDSGDFIVPSVVHRGELTIAVSTGGASPALSRKIRQELEQRYGPEYGLFLDTMTAVRKRTLEEVPDESVRRNIFQELVDSDVLELLRQGKTPEAEARIAEIVSLKRGG